MEEKNGRRKIRRGILLPIVAFVLVVAASAVAVRLLLGGGSRAANGTVSATDSQGVSSGMSSAAGSSYYASSAAGLTDSSAATSSAMSSASQTSSEASSGSTSTVAVQMGDTSYFADAVFIGDSLTSGLKDYNVMKTKGVFATNAMTTRSALVSKMSVNSQSLSVPDAVKAAQPAKVYVLLGANEIRGVTGTGGFITNYGTLVDQLKQAVPQSKIYIQSIFPVTDAYEQEYGVTNDTIDTFNQAIETMCTAKGVTYVDAGSALKGSDGKLSADDASAGYNIKKSAYAKWINYLTAHE